MKTYINTTTLRTLAMLITLLTIIVSCRFGTNNKIDFNKQIRPILNAKCMNCHGGVRQQGDLSFLFPETAILPAQSGKLAIMPGSPSQSELVKRIKHSNPELRMPLDADPLTPNEIKLFEQWIDEGATWGDHWAFVPPKKDISVPDDCIANCKNNIDLFIQEKLKEQGLAPSEQAQNSSLIRRVHLDVTGLPPSIEEVRKYTNNTSADSYEALVDRVLSSDHYGEKWASMWLDLARYADSKGYQKDLLRREIWRYRDWVIYALNSDMPFDQFTIDQLAGDMLDSEDSNKLLATAFHRNTMTNDEGGTDDEEYRVAAVIDRTNTTMEAWQGLTFSCVQCHSHPYDPILHEEYYQMYSFFNNTEDHDSYLDEPLANLLSPGQYIEKGKIKASLENLELAGDTVSNEYAQLLEEYTSIQPGKVQVMQEIPSDSARSTHIFIKGNWLVHGEEVNAQAPKSIASDNWNHERNRLGLANWLVSEDNPLTARVIVNRIWEQIFGRGIVSTLEDFGTQGSPPSHPELLDYLANQLVYEYNWSLKSLIKEILLSSTYRQSSNLSKELLDKDPKNIYLARAPRYRLSAEQIRDQALKISGLLNPKVYGKSVMPDQPEGVWNVIRHAAKWEKSTDGDQHRRGIYTFWRRVSPYPSMMSFDVPSRELCVSRRIRTNTPLQALITLNDPTFVEAAEALAMRMNKEGGSTIEQQVSYGFELALMRKPNAEKLSNLIEFYTTTKLKLESVEHKMQDIDIKNQSMIEVASVLLNLDEVIMKT